MILPSTGTFYVQIATEPSMRQVNHSVHVAKERANQLSDGTWILEVPVENSSTYLDCTWLTRDQAKAIIRADLESQLLPGESLPDPLASTSPIKYVFNQFMA